LLLAIWLAAQATHEPPTEIEPAGQRWHWWPFAARMYPGAQAVQTELDAVVHESAETQFGTGEHAKQALGIPLVR
jgi:hypothetical protein